ncbi:unnamed protein product [Closterium sp. Yama58-4]|nr:unnamed protein product [Closterium sp. Yama58-4]
MVIIGAGRIGQAFMQMAPPNSALFLPRGMPLPSLVQLSPRHSQGPIVVATHNCHLDDVLAQVRRCTTPLRIACGRRGGGLFHGQVVSGAGDSCVGAWGEVRFTEVERGLCQPHALLCELY